MRAERLDVITSPAALRAGPIAGPGRTSLEGQVSAEEWRARVELAALYRLVAHFGWTDTIYTHISMRVPGVEQFLINPFGYLYEEVTASSLVKVSCEGGIIHDPTGLGINLAGFTIHGAVHMARPDVSCVLHTHTRAGVAVSAQEEGLLPISQHAAVVIGKVAYHDAEGIAVRLDERTRIAQNLGSRSILILRNHGLLVAGRSAGETIYLTSMLEKACESQVDALAGGVRVRRLDPSAVEETKAVIDTVDGDFSRDWAAMLRLVERIGPDYKT